jgi:hypothetical protein
MRRRLVTASPVRSPERRRGHVRIYGFLALLGASAAAWAAPDTLEAYHHAGPCGDFKFPTLHVQWQNRGRIALAKGETIHVTLHGHGADLATGVSGENISRWIVRRGTTTDPRVTSGGFPKGYLTIAIKAEDSHTSGNRTVRVNWLTGSETIPVRIVENCEDLAGNDWRRPPPPPAPASSTPRPPATIPTYVSGRGGSTFVDVAPRATLNNVFRRTGNPVNINNGVFLPVDDRWCTNLRQPTTGSIAQTITVPDLVWGASNVGTADIGVGFAAQLRTQSEVLQQVTIPSGLATGATREFQFKRPKSTARVIRFAIPNPQGCFVNPNDPGFFEDPPLIVEADSTHVIAESDETNNVRQF